MQICTSCGEVVATESQKFCSNCGNPVKAKNPEVGHSDPSVNSHRPSGFSESITKLRKKLVKPEDSANQLRSLVSGIRKLVIITLSIAAVLAGLSFVPGLYSPLTAENMPSLDDRISNEDLAEISKKICNQLFATAPSSSTLADLENQIDSVVAVGEGNSGRDLLALSKRVTWLEPSDRLSSFESQVESLVVGLLKETIQGLGILGINSQNESILANKWLNQFEMRVKQNCSFDGIEERVVSVLTRYDTVINRATEVVQAAPWYPEDYFEITSDLAGKWNTFEGSWPCSSCGFWKMKVISKMGCPAGVYVELNITQNGVVVDWTNDTLASLAPGATGQLVFENYPFIPNARGEITEANCR